jgi:hypothetical protein
MRSWRSASHCAEQSVLPAGGMVRINNPLEVHPFAHSVGVPSQRFWTVTFPDVGGDPGTPPVLVGELDVNQPPNTPPHALPYS